MVTLWVLLSSLICHCKLVKFIDLHYFASFASLHLLSHIAILLCIYSKISILYSFDCEKNVRIAYNSFNLYMIYFPVGSVYLEWILLIMKNVSIAYNSLIVVSFIPLKEEFKLLCYQFRQSVIITKTLFW